MKYGLIGEKLGHSYSKQIHEMIGYYNYDLKEIPRDELEAYILGKDYEGLNVTIPYKQDVMKWLDYIDEGAKSIGAVNCIVNRDGKLSGYNTDFFGLKLLIEKSGYSIKGKKVLILGTGGTSKTAKSVVNSLNARDIIVVGRQERDNNISYDQAYEMHSDADFIINTTPAGMYPNIGVAAIDVSRFHKLEAVYDAVYNPSRTQLMLDAAEHGIAAFGGLRMLVYQAIAAAELFVGSKVSADKAEKIFRTIRNESENIVLIGMPAVGKTTLGKRLSKELGMELIDTDNEIVDREKRAISDIFATDGEKYFRDVESQVVKDCSLKKNVIIATGGGAILRDENVQNLKAFGTLYLLNRPIEDLVPTDGRPLANDEEKIRKLYETRMPIYRKVADVIIDGGKGVVNEANQVMRYRNEH